MNLINNYYSNTCGSTADHCGSGCQSKFGSCSEKSLQIRSIRTSTHGQCGADSGMTCKGSRFGRCCSKWGYCGSTDRYCGTGCQYPYGSCSTTIIADVENIILPNQSPYSTDGTCGGSTGNTCFGRLNTPCCSQYGCE